MDGKQSTNIIEEWQSYPEIATGIKICKATLPGLVTIIAAGFVFLPPPYGPAVNIGVVIYTIEMLRKCASMNDTYKVSIFKLKISSCSPK